MITILLLAFLLAQVISPTLDNLISDLGREGDAIYSPHILVDYLLKLSIASTYVWLLVFYGYFHLFFNLLAEILRFGDSVFYRDWWNLSNVSSYWRLWNLPVHYWLSNGFDYQSLISDVVNKRGRMHIMSEIIRMFGPTTLN